MAATVEAKKQPGGTFSYETVSDLIAHLGGIPPERIRLQPPPGTATEKDVLASAEADDRRLCELIDGVLVEKTVGWHESLLAAYLVEMLGAFARTHKLGRVFTPDQLIRILPGQLRMPDVSFIAFRSMPGGRMPKRPIPDFPPDLVAEILSRSNTRAEMARKRHEYFQAGGKLFWEIDPRKRVVRVYASITEVTTLNEAETLDGADVLPGLRLPLRDLFGELDEVGR